MASPILLIVLLIATLPLSIYCSKGFSIDLMHRDSPNSPYHNPSLSKYERIHAAAQRSIARANHFRTYATVTGTTPITTNNSIALQPELISEIFEYLMTISIGTPPLKILAIADTGSDLIWTQCKPCVSCYNQTDPIFDSNNSSSYRTIPCNAETCSAMSRASCDASSLCGYQYSYGDGSTTIGVLSLETFTFESTDKEIVTVPNLSFGCSHSTRGSFLQSDDGIVGLGGGPLSLVSQLGPSIDNKFSYCLAPCMEDTCSTSQIKFGEDAVVNGTSVVTSPLITGPVDTFYYLSLEGINVGGESVNFAAGNIIVDSGTFLTILDDSMMNPLIEKLLQVVKYPRVDDPLKIFDFCINVSNSSEPDLDLNLTFQFSGAPVNMSLSDMFGEVKIGVFCLGIISTGQVGGIRIFGSLAQQNFHMGYDLGARKLSFAPADCSKL